MFCCCIFNIKNFYLRKWFFRKMLTNEKLVQIDSPSPDKHPSSLILSPFATAKAVQYLLLISILTLSLKQWHSE